MNCSQCGLWKGNQEDDICEECQCQQRGALEEILLGISIASLSY